MLTFKQNEHNFAAELREIVFLMGNNVLVIRHTGSESGKHLLLQSWIFITRCDACESSRSSECTCDVFKRKNVNALKNGIVASVQGCTLTRDLLPRGRPITPHFSLHL